MNSVARGDRMKTLDGKELMMALKECLVSLTELWLSFICGLSSQTQPVNK